MRIRRAAYVQLARVGVCRKPSGTLITLAIVMHLVAAPGQGVSQPAQIRVDPDPLLTIGMMSGPDAFLFQFVTEARLLPGDKIVVADRIAGDVRVFSMRGEFLRAFGGQGSGPEEFQHIGGMAVLTDTVMVVDPMLGKVAFFDTAGTLLYTERLRQFGSTLIGVGSNGRAWWSWLAGITNGPHPRMAGDSVHIGVSSSPAGPIQSISGTIVRWRFQRTPYPFSPVTRPAVFRDSLLIADPLTGELSLLDENGKVGRVMRVSLPEIDASAAWEMLDREMNSREQLRDRRKWDMPRVHRLPRMAAMLVDDKQRIWLKQYDPNEDAHWLGGWAGGEGGKWHVVNANGTAVSIVVMPRNVTPLYIGNGLLLRRYRDQWDVQYLTVHRVHGG